MILKDFENLTDGEIYLKQITKNNGENNRFPEYKFQIYLNSTNDSIGYINLRFGNNDKLINYLGHIGYGIDEPFRGNSYSKKACELLKIILNYYSIKEVYLTCNPENFASKKIIEKLGSIYTYTSDTRTYSENEPSKLVYKWLIDLERSKYGLY